MVFWCVKKSLLIFFFSSFCFADAIVISSGRPDFPLETDAATLIVYHASMAGDSTVLTLPVQIYVDFRDNIDTIFNYAEALRDKRTELSLSDSCYARLEFRSLGLRQVSVAFRNRSLKTGKLACGADRYPFVVVFTKGFAGRLRKYIHAAR